MLPGAQRAKTNGRKRKGVMNSEKFLALRSVTHAFKAKKLLASYGISSRVIKNSDKKIGGCAYGIAVGSDNLPRAQKILSESGIEATALS